MFCYLNAYNFMLISLVLGSYYNVVLCDDDDDSAAESIEVENASVEQTDDDGPLTDCRFPNATTKAKCCKLNIEMDDELVKCAVLHQKKMPKESEKNPNVLIKFVSCLVQCIYKSKKYISKDDTLNMAMVKADANKKFKDDPREKNFMIEMYEFCQHSASNDWGTYKSNVAAKVLFKGACKPYFLFVFMCTASYTEKIKCPHFKWKGEESATKNTIADCEELKSVCEELVSNT